MSIKAYTETEVEQLLKNYIVQEFLYGEPKPGLANDWLLIEEGAINSLGILTLVSFIEERFGIFIASEEMTLENFKDINSIKSLVLSKVKLSTQKAVNHRKEEFTSLTPINPNGTKKPLFYVHSVGGLDSVSRLVRYLDAERPLYSFQAVGLDGEKAPYTRIEDMVEHYIQEIQTVQLQGPYLLVGGCIGGNIAFEIAQQLKKRGQQVLLVVMIDSPNPWITEKQKRQTWNHWISSEKQNRREKLIHSGLNFNRIESILNVCEANYKIIINHAPQMYSGRVVYLSANENREQQFGHRFDPMQPNGWNDWVADGIELYEVSGSHLTLHFEAHVQELAEKLNTCLEEAFSTLAVGL